MIHIVHTPIPLIGVDTRMTTQNKVYLMLATCLAAAITRSQSISPLPSIPDVENIILDANNTYTLRGKVNDQMADAFIYNVVANTLHVNSNINIFINSEGGSVLAGNRIVDFIKNKNYTCIAARAYSMAFVILQACKNRYVLSSATVMQHQQSLSLEGELSMLNNFLHMTKSIEEDLDAMQSKRIGMTVDAFKAKVNNEWWLYGADIVKNNVADKIVSVECTPALLTKTEHSVTSTFFRDVNNTYSGCPLLYAPIQTTYIDTFFA